VIIYSALSVITVYSKLRYVISAQMGLGYIN